MKLESFKSSVNGEEIEFYFRRDSIGDRGVLKQIFMDEDYRVSHWGQGKLLIDYYQKRQANGETALIIDAGANIGSSAVYFAKNYPSSLVLAVEPEKSNVALLNVNVDKLNVKVFQAAIGCENGEMFLQDPGLSDVGFRVVEKGNLAVKVMSPAELISSVKNQSTFPFIFKIDIEGGESDLFKKDFEWVDSFPMIVIELHDWMLPFQGSSRTFFKAISSYDFDIVYRGENIFCFNKRILAP
jgi:FkbM family methyltransferase